MPDFSSPRVIARERRTGTPQIRGVPTSVGAMVGRALRGRIGRAVRVTSFPQFQRIYGTYDANSHLPHQADLFFKNGGSVLYVSRVQGSGGGSNVAASRTLSTSGPATAGSMSSGASAFPAVLAVGDTFTGAVDGGAPATATIAATRAMTTGAGATYAAGAGGDSVSIIISGVLGGAAQVIDLSTAGATQASYLNLINASLVGGMAIDQGGQIRIQTDQLGSGAGGSISALGGAAAAKTGLAVAAFTNAGPNNVANVSAVTAAELVALFEATWAGSTSTAPTSTSMTWASDTTGASSSVRLTAGTGVAKITGFDTTLHSGAASSSQPSMTFTAVGPGSDYNKLSVKVTSVNTQLDSTIPTLVSSGSVTEFRVNQAVASRLVPGDTLKFVDSTTGPTTARGIVKQIQGDKIIFNAAVTLSGNLTAANTTVTLETFSVSILEGGNVVQGPIEGLRLSSLSKKNYFVSVLNAANEEYLVSVADLGASGSNLDLRPANTLAAGDALTSGAEATTFADNDYIGSQGSGTGLYAFDKKREIRMIAIPGITGSTEGAVSKALAQYCEARANCVAIIAPPQSTSSAANVVTYFSTKIGGNGYAIPYSPWLKGIAPLSGLEEIFPPEGSVMGFIAKNDRQRGVQKAPAGEEAKLVGTSGVEYEWADADRDLLYPANINPIVNLEDAGQCIMGARTLEKGTDYELVSVRRTFIYLRESLELGTRFSLFEEQGPELWGRVDRAIESFLFKEWKKGTLKGDTEEEAFSVVCDETNNSSIVGSRITASDVFVNVPETVEGLLITIGRK